MSSEPPVTKGFSISSEIFEHPSFVIPPHPSVKTNKLLSEQKKLAEVQLEILRASSEESSATALRAVRLAKWANIIATVAAIMATVAAIPVIVEAYGKFIH